jgi:hypothetical protein
MTSLILAALHHDYRKQRSFVTLEWLMILRSALDFLSYSNALRIGFRQAEKAIKAIAKELEQAKIQRA